MNPASIARIRTVLTSSWEDFEILFCPFFVKVSHKGRFDRKNLKTIRCQRYWSKFSLGEGIKFHDFHFSFGRERNREKDVIKILSIRFYQNSLPLIGKLTDFLSDSLSFLVIKWNVIDLISSICVVFSCKNIKSIHLKYDCI